ncbi:MAG: hypothetical protein AAGJ18_08955 [Bacteroidota bacterium]
MRIEEEVSGKLNQYVKHIKNRIDANFGSFDTMLENEQKQIAALEEKHQNLEGSLDELAVELNKIL